MQEQIFAAIGPMNWSDRDKNFTKFIARPEINPILTSGAMGFQEHIATGFLEQAKYFIDEVPHVFPKDLVAKPFLDKFMKEAGIMAKYPAEMGFYQKMMPEYYALTHPNAQVDNAYYWRNDAGEMQCGLLDWDSVGFGSMSECIGNGWMGAEADTMAEHEDKLVRCFVDEYKRAGGEELDFDTFYMCMKLAQAAVMYGCMANLGQLRRIVSMEDWKGIKNRYDPKVDKQFLTRCYYVQVELFLAMWPKRSPYQHFLKWMERTGRPIR